MPFALGLSLYMLSAALQATGTAITPASVPTVPRDRLLAASQASSLRDSDLKPWHLKLAVTLFDATGKNPSTGTIETWHSGKKERTVYAFGASKFTLLRTPDESYEGQEGPAVPGIADFILDKFLSPGPSVKDVDASKVETEKESFGNVKLDCIMLTQTIHHDLPFPIGLFPTYCFDLGSENLRASYNFGSYTLLRNGLGKFQDRQVATHISLMNDQIQIADARAVTFSTFTPAPGFFQPEPSLAVVSGNHATIPGGVIAGAILKKISPTYPESAKQRHVSGTVVLRALIGRDGHIYDLRPVTAPDTALAGAALLAVRQWTYKPYLLNGFPTEVDTTITVNFNLSSY